MNRHFQSAKPRCCLLAGLLCAAFVHAGTPGAPAPAAPPATNTFGRAAVPHVHQAPTNALADARAAGFCVTGFDHLAGFAAGLTLTPHGPEMKGRIPPEVLALSERRVAVAGFMTPVRMRDGKVTEFLLQRYLSACCQPEGPPVNEWILVRMNAGGAENVRCRPVVAAGRLVVGEYRENGRLRAIYRMEGERLFDRE